MAWQPLGADPVTGALPPVVEQRIGGITSALAAWAKSPDLLVAGGVTYSGGLLATADVVWPDGATGTLTITSRQTGTDAVTGYTITRELDGEPTTTYTQPTITRDSSGNATLVPQIAVA